MAEVGDKLYFFEIRSCEGTLQKNFFGQLDYMPDKPEFEWGSYRILDIDKNNAIDQMISTLNAMRDKDEAQ
jgi:hypothetical protein